MSETPQCSQTSPASGNLMMSISFLARSVVGRIADCCGWGTTSVEMPLPVLRDAAGRTGNRLIGRMMVRRSQGGPLVVLIHLVVPEPVLAGFEGLHQRM